MSTDLQTLANRVKEDHGGYSNKIPDSEESIPVIPESNNEDEIDLSDYDPTTIRNEFEVSESESIINGDDFDDEDDEPVVVSGVTDFPINENSNVSFENAIETMDDGTEEPIIIGDDELKEFIPDIPDEDAEPYLSELRELADANQAMLIASAGLGADEARAATMIKLEKKGTELNAKYIVDHPQVNVVIDKRNSDKLEFTEDEKKKLVKSKVIHLEVVENAEIEHVKTKRIDKTRKVAMLQSMNTGLSRYSVPLPMLGDYCQFKGSQIIQLAQAVRYDDATFDEVISKKASLVYSQLINGSVLRKMDDNNKIDMDYKTFINKFLFHDLDLGLYAILVASSMEDIESEITCGECHRPTKIKYNIKSLLSTDGMNDTIKERFEDILEHKTDSDYLNELHNKINLTHIVKSPLTKNIYYFNYPTVARAIELYKRINQEDQVMVYLTAFILFLDKVKVYDKDNDDYMDIEEDEYSALFEFIQSTPQEELDVIQEYLKPYVYTPNFVLHSKCDKCGNTMKNKLKIDDLVFLKAQDSSMEIRS